jgi:glycosyltransferase involved in cell wall biosynthesis
MPSPRALVLAASIARRHVTGDPVRALLLAWRVLPGPLRGWLRFAGPYGRATALWGAGERNAALTAAASPRRLAAFALAVDQPAAAAAALAKLAQGDPARPVLTARLAWREGRLTEARQVLDGASSDGASSDGASSDRASNGRAGGGRAGGGRARRLRRALAAEQAILAGTHPRLPGTRAPAYEPVPGRVLHLVTDALPATSAGYTIRTQEIAVAQRAAGLDPHVVTRCGYPVTQGRLDGRRLVTLDGVPYHRLLPLVMPGRADTAADRGLNMAAGLVAGLRPAILHAASNFANARIALALRERYGVPVVYEVRGFWEDTWLSRHPDGDKLASSELYLSQRDLETRSMLAADLVVTLGEAMRDEIAARGIPAEKILIVPNAVSAEFLRPLPDAAALRKQLGNELGIEPGEYVVGVVSTLSPYEGIGTLLEATSILRARGVPVRALIVGDGPERAALEHQAASGGLAQAVTFTGRVPAAKVHQFHALLDIFVVPRTRDRVCQLVTPLKPVEAMASGLCVVTSEVKALTEIVKHEVTGALTVPQDPVSLADCLERLLYSPDIRRKLGDNARQWAVRDRTWAQNAARYRDAYARLGAI